MTPPSLSPDDESFVETYRAWSFWIAAWAGVWLGAATVTVFEAESLLARLLGLTVIAGSAASVVLYGIDKFAAVGKKRRLPEATLHLTALIGGWPGAALGQRMFRHKTRKASFLLKFLVTAAVHTLFCVVAFLVLTLLL
jgi:uncharacterized membrane protein YsdA (DUF1294 family)